MKKLFIIAVLCATANCLKAQNSNPWPTSGNVGIGTNAPLVLLEVSKDVGSGNTNTMQAWSWVNPTSTWGLRLDQHHTGSAIDHYFIQNLGGTDANVLAFHLGKVGIGTTSPNYLLDVNGVGNFTGINLNSAQSKVAADVDIAFGTVNTGKFIGQYYKNADQLMHFYNGTGGADILQLDQNNNNVYVPYGGIGVGTNSMPAKLSVAGDGYFTGPIGVGAVPDAYASYQATVTNSSNVFLRTNNATDGKATYFSQDGTSGVVMNTSENYFRVATSGVFDANFNNGGISVGNSYIGNTAPSNGLIVQGNTGIGTTDPQAKLSIFNNHNNSTNLILAANYENTYRWRFNTIDRGSAIDLDITASNYLDQQEAILKLSPTCSGRPQFALENNWLVAQNGNIGIGTTDNATWQLASSAYKLAVAGNVVAEEVAVKLHANWPDYVFKPKYNLLPLCDLKTYIDKNHHLPEMPSAEQVEKDGLNLGEMNKLLTKKVEELTLYLLKQDERIKKLEAQIKEVK